MKRALLVPVLLALLVLPWPAHAQKDTLTVALVSHAETLDPHMHFQRMGILVNINMFDSLLHKNTEARVRAVARHVVEGGERHHVGVQAPQGREVPQRRDHDRRGREVLLRAGARPGKRRRSPQYGNIRAIKEVKVVDAETIQLVTDKPFPLLLERMVFFPIVPKKHMEKVGDEAFGRSAPSAPGRGSSWSGSATSTSGSRRSTSTGAASPRSRTSSSAPSPRSPRRSPS